MLGICAATMTPSGILRADLLDDVDASLPSYPAKIQSKQDNKSDGAATKPKAGSNEEVKKSSVLPEKGMDRGGDELQGSQTKNQKGDVKSKKERTGSKANEKGTGQADSSAKEDGSRRAHIYFKSDGKSTYTKEGDVILLERNVVITQENMRFRSDTAKVFLEKDGDENSVRMAEFNGHVDVNKSSDNPAEEVTASGNRAQFFNDTRKVELIGNAHLWRGGHLIKGKQITYFMDTGMITVDEAQGVVKPEGVKKK